MHFECIKCGACCKQTEMIVTLTGRDITRIGIGLELTPKQIIRALDFYVSYPGEDVPLGLDHIPALSTENGMAIIALKKNDDGTCIFLKDDLCMIHQIRPGACKSFPFVFDKKNGDITWGLSAMKDICPGLGTGKPVSTSDIIDIASIVLEDLQIYREFAEEWNKSDADHTAFDVISTINSDIRFLV